MKLKFHFLPWSMTIFFLLQALKFWQSVEFGAMKMLAKNLFILITLVRISQSEFIYRFTQIHCTSTGKSVKFLFCYPKTYDRKVFTVNIGIDVLRAMDTIMVSFVNVVNFNFSMIFLDFALIRWTSQ